ncbi:hypothetical protein M086_4025 [Bacteroides fragilis str. S13 L11]|nr:hypothetical protein M086_4025 [Bacteroides fragilis str. S13 L11]
MRERAVFSVLVDAQIPYNSRQKNNRGFHEEIALFLYIG